MIYLESRIIKIIQTKQKELERKEKQIENFQNNPLMLFDELQYERDIIPQLLASIDESLLLEYQTWQYPYVHKALIENFNIAPLIIAWDDETFPSPFYLLNDGYPVAMIHPYEQTFEVLPTEEITDMLTNFKNLSKSRIDAWERYQQLLIYEWNPYVGSDDSMRDALKVMFTKGKKTKEIQAEQRIVLSDYEQLTDACSRQLLQIETASRDAIIKNYQLDNIFNELKVKLPLKYKDLHEEIIMETNQEIAQLEEEAQERIAELQKEANETEQI